MTLSYMLRAPRDVLVVLVCLVLSLCVLASSMYTGLNGNFVWRQADAYSQILGLLGQGELTGLMNFQGQPSFYDVPLYQAILAALADILQADPLAVTRGFNLLIWIVFFGASIAICDYFADGSAKFMAIFLASAPLYLHYFATPLPDLLAFMLAVLGLLGWVQGRRCLSLAGFALATLIKSPLALVLLVFCAVYHVLRKRRIGRFELGGSLCLLAIAITAETARTLYLADQAYLDGHDARLFAQDPRWYFGTLGDRFSPGVWSAAAIGTLLKPFAHAWLGGAVVGGAVLAAGLLRPSGDRRAILLAAVAAALIGWLVFPRLYRIHDYYLLPSSFAVLLACAVIFGLAEARWAGTRARRIIPIVLILAVFPLNWLGQSLRAPVRVSQYEVTEYLARPADRVLLVTDAAFGVGPVFGGWIGRQFDRMDTKTFRQNAEVALNTYDFIAIREDAFAVTPQVSQRRIVLELDTYRLLLRTLP